MFKWKKLILDQTRVWDSFKGFPSSGCNSVKFSLQNAVSPSGGCSGPAVRSADAAAPPSGRTAFASGSVFSRRLRPGSGRRKGSEADWLWPWTTPAGCGWDGGGRAANRRRGWRCYTPRTLRRIKSRDVNEPVWWNSALAAAAGRSQRFWGLKASSCRGSQSSSSESSSSSSS